MWWFIDLKWMFSCLQLHQVDRDLFQAFAGRSLEDAMKEFGGRGVTLGKRGLMDDPSYSSQLESLRALVRVRNGDSSNIL